MSASPTALYISAGIKKMKEDRGTTPSQIAERLNLSYAQVRKLKDLQVEKPNFTTAIKFFSLLRTNKETRKKLIKEDYPAVYQHEQELEKRAPAGTVDPSHALKTSNNPMAYRIYALANCDYGIERTTIKETWGDEGTDILNTLIDEEILQENSGHITSFSEKHRDTDREIIRTKQSYCLDFSDLKDPDSWLSLITQSVNLKAYRDIRKLSKEFFYQINTIITDKSNRGPIPLFLTINLGKLLKRKER